MVIPARNDLVSSVVASNGMVFIIYSSVSVTGRSIPRFIVLFILLNLLLRNMPLKVLIRVSTYSFVTDDDHNDRRRSFFSTSTSLLYDEGQCNFKVTVNEIGA